MIRFKKFVESGYHNFPYADLNYRPMANLNADVRKVKGGYRWGKSGKVYKTKKAAERQGRAIYASGYRNGKKKRSKTKKSRR